MSNSMFVIVVEDLKKGLQTYGPFATRNKAEQYAWKKFSEEDNDTAWWIKKVIRTKSNKKERNIRKAAKELLDAAENLFADASDRGEVYVDVDHEDRYEEHETLGNDGEHYYPDWLAIKRAIENLRTVLN